MARIGVAGTTSWGTTLAIVCASRGQDVRLWARTDEEASRLCADRENRRLLPGAPFPPALTVTASVREAFGDADLVVIAVPSSSLRSNVKAIRDSLGSSAPIVSATKGLELSSGKRMSQVLEEELPTSLHPTICALSGPNLAQEIVDGKPSSTVVASANEDTAKQAQSLLTSVKFRVYTNTDIIGVELGAP